MNESGSPDAIPNDVERAEKLIQGGAELAGAAVGAAVGLVGGPAGALGGAAAGVAATRTLRHVGSELQTRWLGPRQRVRVGAAYAYAAEQIADRLAAGEALRADGFFEEDPTVRSAGEEILEGVLQAAADAYEEKKVAHLGKLYASLAFDAGVSRGYANFLIGVARSLTFRELALMAVIWEGDVARLPPDERAGKFLFDDELGL
jgi:hypothetical protein